MSDIFITSDNHFSHANFLTFTDEAGNIYRKFGSVEEMDQVMIDNWNKVVSKNSKIYNLGDLCFSKDALHRIMPQLNGTKILIKGNHDKFRMQDYMRYFKDVRGSHRLEGMLLTHIPLHPYIFERVKANIHGHTHHHNVQLNGADDPRYFNVCVEKHDYTPIELDVILDYYKEVK